MKNKRNIIISLILGLVLILILILPGCSSTSTTTTPTQPTLMDRIAAAEARLTNVESVATNANTKVTSVEASINKITTQPEISTLKSDISEVKANLSSLKSQVSTPNSDIQTLKTQISELNNKIDELSVKFNAHLVVVPTPTPTSTLTPSLVTASLVKASLVFNNESITEEYLNLRFIITNTTPNKISFEDMFLTASIKLTSTRDSFIEIVNGYPKIADSTSDFYYDWEIYDEDESEGYYTFELFNFINDDDKEFLEPNQSFTIRPKIYFKPANISDQDVTFKFKVFEINLNY
jgi:hypothetical protein